MTREEQISDAAQICDVTANRHDLDVFEAGARWADANPNWHKYPEEKPKQADRLLVMRYDGIVDIAEYSVYVGGFYHYFNGLEDVLAWMKLPEPPKFN